MSKQILRLVATAISVVIVVIAALNFGGATNQAPQQVAAQAEPTRTPAYRKAFAVYVDPRLLVSNNDAYIDKNIWVQGRALSVEQYEDFTWVQVLAQPKGETLTESIIVYLQPPASLLLSDECYLIYGVMAGTSTMTLRLTGVDVEVPTLLGYLHMESPAGEYFGCEAPS